MIDTRPPFPWIPAGILSGCAMVGLAAMVMGVAGMASSLSDAERVWCRNNQDVVRDVGIDLGLGLPGRWAHETDDYVEVDGWALHADGADYARACRTAYEIR